MLAAARPLARNRWKENGRPGHPHRPAIPVDTPIPPIKEFVDLLLRHRRLLEVALRPGAIELVYWGLDWLEILLPLSCHGRFLLGEPSPSFLEALTLASRSGIPSRWGLARGLEYAQKLGLRRSKVINFNYGAIELEPVFR